MGLSTKQVSNDHGLDWSQNLLDSELPKPPPTKRQQQQQQQSEPLKCPRCGSTYTKFCYYNNYNKSQPRHFCKACKRHWTKGGTLRNVPVGGGRSKSKRPKTSSNAARATTTTTAFPASTIDRDDLQLEIRRSEDHNLPVAAPLGDQKITNIPDILYHSLISSSPSVHNDSIKALSGKSFMSNRGKSAVPIISLPHDQSLQFSFSGLSPFDNNIPSSIPSFNQSLDAYDYLEKLDSVESSTITTVTPTTTSSIFSQPWQAPTTSSAMTEVPNYWNWNDIDTLVSADLNIPWDDTDINLDQGKQKEC